MPTIKFLNEKKSIEVPQGSNLRTEARKNGIQLYSGPEKIMNCMGFGACTACRVHVKKGLENVSPAGWWERINLLKPITLGFFARIGHEHELRLACQMRVNGDCEIETRPSLNWHGEKFWA